MSIKDDLAQLWAEIESWGQAEFKTISKAELALLKSEIPAITKAAALALEDFVIAEAQRLEQTALGGPEKASSLGSTIKGALAVGLAAVDGQSVSSSSVSTMLLNALVEAGATAARVGLPLLLAAAI